MAKEATETQTGSLQDFSFDNDTWFGQKEEIDATEQVLKEVKGTAKTVADDGEGGETKVEATNIKDTKTKEDEDEEEPTFFGEEKPEDKPKEEDEETEEEEGKDKGKKKEKDEGKDNPENDDKFFTTLAGELKEKGIFQNVELKEGEEITEEKFFELQDAEIEKRVEETFEAFFEELDEDAKNFLRFKKNGGKTADFFASHTASAGIDLDNFDVENEAQRTQMLTHYLSTVEKLDAEDIKDRIEWLKEGGKEKTYATKYQKAMQATRDELKETIVKSQEEAAKQREAEVSNFNNSLNETLGKTETVGAFTFTKNDQKELGGYITKPTVKVGKNKYVPAFQAEIANIFRADSEESKQKLLLLAKLVKSNFDVSDLVTETKTKVVKQAKSRLQEAKTGVKPSTSGNYTKKSLGDYFS